jgi:acyl-CoA thioesterase FadM
MPRIKLDLPKHFHFTTEIPIRISDINYGGHLGNDAVLSILHESRVRLLLEHGYSEFNVEGVGIIMTDSAIVYKSEAFYGELPFMISQNSGAMCIILCVNVKAEGK